MDLHAVIDKIRSAGERLLEMKKQAADPQQSAAFAHEAKTAALLFASLKAGNRAGHTELDAMKEAVIKENQKVDAHHLALQNLLYEKGHIASELAKCMDLSTPQLDAVTKAMESEASFLQKQQESGAVVSDAAHDLFLQRLSDEDSKRKELHVQLQQMRMKLQQLRESTAQSKAAFEALPNSVDSIQKALQPLQTEVTGKEGAADTSASAALQSAGRLPAALYSIFFTLDSLCSAAAVVGAADSSGWRKVFSLPGLSLNLAVVAADAVGSESMSMPAALSKEARAAREWSIEVPSHLARSRAAASILSSVAASSSSASAAGAAGAAGAAEGSMAVEEDAAAGGAARGSKRSRNLQGNAAGLTQGPAAPAGSGLRVPAADAFCAHPTALLLSLREESAISSAAPLPSPSVSAASSSTCTSILFRYYPLLDAVSATALQEEAFSKAFSTSVTSTSKGSSSYRQLQLEGLVCPGDKGAVTQQWLHMLQSAEEMEGTSSSPSSSSAAAPAAAAAASAVAALASLRDGAALLPYYPSGERLFHWAQVLAGQASAAAAPPEVMEGCMAALERGQEGGEAAVADRDGSSAATEQRKRGRERSLSQKAVTLLQPSAAAIVSALQGRMKREADNAAGGM